MPKMLLILFIFNIEMATQKFTNFDKFFLTHTDRTAVTMQSNKIVSNEVKDNQVLLEPSYGKSQMNYITPSSMKTK